MGSQFSTVNSGDYSKTRNALTALLKNDLVDLNKYGQMGVDALIAYSPVDSGLMQKSWGYRITDDKYGPTIEWYNTDIENGYSVAILIQYGHATRNGAFVQGHDYVNPAMEPIFNQIANEIWKKVSA